MDSRVIKLTPAASKYGNLNLSSCGKDFFPPDVFGGSCRIKGIGTPITLKVKGLTEPVKTDIPTDIITGKPRWLFRERSWVKTFVRIHNLAKGDLVIIRKVGNRAYSIAPSKPHALDLPLNQQLHSPFRYAGGKFYARKLILEHIPEHSCYIEPFAGGASIFFAKRKERKNWLNDIDEDLTNCLIIIRDYPESLIDRLKDERATKKRHAWYKNVYNPETELDRAVRWFYLNRTSYSGIMLMKNCYWGYHDKYSMRPENWPQQILSCSHKLKNVKLTTLDFEKIIEKAEDNSFLFVDPPYFNADQDKFYTHSFKKSDHFRLCRVLKKNSKRLKFLLTYDNSPEVREMYKWATDLHEKEWNYTLNRTDDQRKNAPKRKGNRYKGQELFVVNYNSVKQPNLF